MDVRLKVVQGKPLGKLFLLPAPRFLIGRADDCHLRPNSDLVDSHQCAILNDGGEVRVEHLGQANGTHVNGKAIEGKVKVKSGDLLQVGPLVFAFELIATPVELVQKSETTPAAEAPTAATSTSVAEPSEVAATTQQTAEPSTASLEEELASSVLNEVDEEASPVSETPAVSEEIADPVLEAPDPVLDAATEDTPIAEPPASQPEVEDPSLEPSAEAAAEATPLSQEEELVTGAEMGEDGDVMDWLSEGPEPASTGIDTGEESANGSPATGETQPDSSGKQASSGGAKKQSDLEKTSTVAADILRKWTQGGRDQK